MSETRLAEKRVSMIIAEKIFELPTEDTHKLEIVEVRDMGVIATAFGDKEKINIRILVTDQKASDGSNIFVSVFAAKSIGPKSTLGKFLRKLGFNTTGQFDMDDLIGFKFSAVIEHNEAANGKTYANVGSIVKTTRAVEQV